MDTTYTASKTRSNRPGWSVTFRHPLRRDARGKTGLKMRRGLDTTDAAQADTLVEQLNEMLADQSWWSPDRRADAAMRFAPQVVSAFFDGIETASSRTDLIRETKIHLPTKSEGYARALLVGTTGAGKTTLLRHLIGSSHRDRFPSTSTARTTIADTEIITREGAYKAVATFMSEFETRAHIDECIEAACVSALEGHTEFRIANALLNHKEQRFRLSYILGDWSGEPDEQDDAFSFEAPPPLNTDSKDEEFVPERERRANAARLTKYISRIKSISRECAARIAATDGPFKEQILPEAKTEWVESFIDTLYEDEQFSNLAIEIKEDVETRFDFIPTDELERNTSGWPRLWIYESDGREKFLSKVRWLSSNYFRQFGRLLTPLVNGIRVRGPFWPRNPSLHLSDKFVFIDSQGLGHTADTVSSISTSVTEKLGDVDLIILVDSAQQPMQAAPLAMLRAAATGGHTNKLALAFTHFDLVKGDNLRTFAQKRNHLITNLTIAVSSLRSIIGPTVAVAVEKQLESKIFLLGALDREIDEVPPGVIAQIGALLGLLRDSGTPAPPIIVAPNYRIAGLELALRAAVEGFLRSWEARLGFAYREEIKPEHWTRIRALTRRFANNWGDEYDDLRPASDLILGLQEAISRWLEVPASWTHEPASDEERSSAINVIRAKVFEELHRLVDHRLSKEHQRDWSAAYGESGQGSGLRRASTIRRIYEESAPLISSSMRPPARKFVAEVVDIIKQSVEVAGGAFEGVNEILLRLNV